MLNTLQIRRVSAVLVAALAVTFASDLPAQRPSGPEAPPPALLPSAALQAARPLARRALPPCSPSMDLHRMLDDCRDGRWTTALDRWNRVQIPCEAEVWRAVGRSACYLHLGRLVDAERELAAARDTHPENVAVWYQIALLRIRQAQAASDWPDALRPTAIHRVAFQAAVAETPATGKTRQRYELEAIAALEETCCLAERLETRTLLIPTPTVIPAPYPPRGPETAPTVEQLLTALEADDLASRAHRLLARLFAEQGRSALAAHHGKQAGPLAEDLASELGSKLRRDVSTTASDTPANPLR